MIKDIENREDIALVVDRFYERVRKDDQIAKFFTEVVSVNWEKHLPRMYDFWENTLFGAGTYSGNPMQVHKDVHQKSPLSESDFARWQALFIQNVDELFAGENAERIKQRAQGIAVMMQIKVLF